MGGATGSFRVERNVTRVLTDAFVSARDGNLHLREPVSGVVDAGEPMREVIRDIDEDPRDATPDVGADEFKKSNERPR
jgi:hypothetical protein